MMNEFEEINKYQNKKIVILSLLGGVFLCQERRLYLEDLSLPSSEAALVRAHINRLHPFPKEGGMSIAGRS